MDLGSLIFLILNTGFGMVKFGMDSQYIGYICVGDPVPDPYL
jgi:hypothetical protein